MSKMNLKIYITFAAILIFCFMVGYLSGKCGAHLQEDIDAIDWVQVSCDLIRPALYMFLCIVAGGFASCLGMFFRVRRKLIEIEKLSDDEYEERLPMEEKKLSKISLVNNIVFMVSIVLYPFVILCDETSESLLNNGVYAQEACVIFIVEIAFLMTINALIVGVEKKLNPEKEGNVFDFHFKRKWYSSMDEAEIIKTAKASAKGYNAGIITCYILWIVSLMLMLTFHTGIWPIVCVSAVMLVMNLVATIDSMK